MKVLTSHHVNECNRQITVEAQDAPGAGGAHNHYTIKGPPRSWSNGVNMSPLVSVSLRFQQGDPARLSQASSSPSSPRSSRIVSRGFSPARLRVTTTKRPSWLCSRRLRSSRTAPPSVKLAASKANRSRDKRTRPSAERPGAGFLNRERGCRLI